jgi:predicted MFS family arabinose efflux permease
MLPLELFARRNFAIGNVETLAMYGGLSITSFVLVLFLQEVAGYSAVQSGLATIPITLVMFGLSKRMGALADRFGPRRFMGFGPILAGAGMLLYQRVGRDAPYVSEVLPAVIVFALGLSMTVAPLTATVLADADERNAGIASGVNNAIARVAGLLGVALVGLITGEAITLAGFHQVTLVSAVLVLAAGLLGLLGIVDPAREVRCAECPGGALAGAPPDGGPP